MSSRTDSWRCSSSMIEGGSFTASLFWSQPSATLKTAEASMAKCLWLCSMIIFIGVWPMRFVFFTSSKPCLLTVAMRITKFESQEYKKCPDMYITLHHCKNISLTIFCMQDPDLCIYLKPISCMTEYVSFSISFSEKSKLISIFFLFQCFNCNNFGQL